MHLTRTNALQEAVRRRNEMALLRKLDSLLSVFSHADKRCQRSEDKDCARQLKFSWRCVGNAVHAFDRFRIEQLEHDMTFEFLMLTRCVSTESGLHFNAGFYLDSSIPMRPLQLAVLDDFCHREILFQTCCWKFDEASRRANGLSTFRSDAAPAHLINADACVA